MANTSSTFEDKKKIDVNDVHPAYKQSLERSGLTLEDDGKLVDTNKVTEADRKAAAKKKEEVVRTDGREGSGVNSTQVKK